MVKRGEIYYIEPSKALQTTGSEQRANRPGIIVSSDANNKHSKVVEIVYLTTQQKNDMLTHVTINSAVRQSIALCEQINTISINRVADYMGQCTAEEMQKIDNALLESLDINNSYSCKKEYEEKAHELQKEVENYVEKLKERLE